MLSLRFALTLYFFILMCNRCDFSIVEGYAWRDFTREVPSDAFEGGLDHDGNPIYIGQAQYGNNIYVGKIYKNDKKVYFAVDNSEKMESEYLKILCSGTPNKFKWLEVEANKLHLVMSKHMVLGGFQDSSILYVGRAYFNLEVSIGKIVSPYNVYPTGCFTKNGNVNCFDSFEILTFEN